MCLQVKSLSIDAPCCCHLPGCRDQQDVGLCVPPSALLSQAGLLAQKDSVTPFYVVLGASSINVLGDILLIVVRCHQRICLPTIPR